ncbi:WD40-repeat-containing domain protein [Phascolomyces articulosus]|uniref:WD40-repeat-containing domain protein n=1 Tax=Phascolomyces articulosus TaxID=60185 RepID=A0AAD5KJT9_9FUNG|nr:WD40-repeat-containing domain protein [Phascolomyces articulosus]
MEIEPQESDQINTEYKLWKKNTPFLYDLLMTHGLEWPSLTCQWFPDVERRPDQNYKTQRLLLGTHTNDEEPNYLQIASVQLPLDQHKVDTRKYDDNTNEIGGYGGYNDANMRITQKIVHEGEINRARYQYENPNVIATKARTGSVFVFDRTMHESFPKENERCNPALRLQGHEREGYGLEWNPHNTSSNHLLSSGFDNLICHWDIAAATKENRVLDPLRVYSGHSAGVEDVAWHSSHDAIFASASDDRHLMIWDTRNASAEPIHDVWAHAAEVNCVSFCPSNEWILATGSSDKTAAIWDIRNLNAKIHTLEFHQEEVYHLSWSPHFETVLATASSDRRILIWDLSRIGDSHVPTEDGPPELLFMHAGHTGGVSDLSWSPEEPWSLASVAEDNMVHVWQMASNIYEQDHDNSATAAEDDKNHNHNKMEE